MGKKRGRPKEVNSKRETCITRMTIEDKYILNKVCQKEGLNKSEAMRLGIKALDYLSKNGGIYCITENQNIQDWNYCNTEIDDEDDDLY